MDTLARDQEAVESVLAEYTKIPYAHGDIHTETVFDRMNDRYLVVNVGWDRGKRVHGALVHIDIIDGKLWIQRDGTERGIATDLMEAGIPNERIVLGFRSPELQKYTEFAVA